jgi:hypothetical protein
MYCVRYGNGHIKLIKGDQAGGMVQDPEFKTE